ncbi:MAG: class I SAM-dependent methyltransferase [Planctomycetaceae bacterium]
MQYLRVNSAAYDRMVAAGSVFAKVASDEEVAEPLKVLDGRGWLPASVAGMDVLCLAAGGGWQSVLYAAAGAKVTVVDLSPAMLRLDEREAKRRGSAVTLIEGSMDDLSILPEAGFDVVHQPVSTCYVPDVEKVYREIARVLRDGGIYISQHKQPASLQVTHRTPEGQYVVGLEYYRDGALPTTDDDAYREAGTAEYLHRWEQLVGGLCRSGFVLEDMTEPLRADRTSPIGHFRHRGRYVPPYVRLKARRVARTESREETSRLWVP